MTSFDLDAYKTVSESVILYMNGWIMVAAPEERRILIDLRDAVGRRATERINK